MGRSGGQSSVVLPSVVHAFGHSYISGAMTNPTTNRQSAKLAAACHATETNKGVGSSILCTNSNIGGQDTSTPPAGIVGVLQNIAAARTPGTDQFLSPIQCAVICWGINDWAIMGAAQFAISFPANLHSAIRRFRTGAIFEDNDASVTYPTGTWVQTAGTTANSGATNHNTASATASVSIAVPSQYQGQAITLGFIDSGNATTINVVDETAANRGTLTTGSYSFVQTQRRFGYPSIYIPAGTLASGSHTLTVNYTSVVTQAFFDYWSIESVPTPLIIIQLANRIPDYTKHASGWPNAPLNDAAITSMNTIMQTVAATYTDGRVVCVPVDDIVGNLASNLTSDSVHPNSGVAGQMAYRFVSAIQNANAGRSDLLRLGTA